MIRTILFAILFAHSALVAQGKPSRIILQAPPPNPTQGVSTIPLPTGGVPQPPVALPPQVPIVEQTIITNPNSGTTSSPQAQTQPAATVSNNPATTATPNNNPATTASNNAVTTGSNNPATTASVTPQQTATPRLTTVIIPAPITPAPVTPAPVTPAPVTPAPVTPAPVTPTPTTAMPTTKAPTTGVPTTAAPTTAAPTLPPLPEGFEYGTWAQVCPIPGNNQDCMIRGEMIQSEATNNRGIVNCDRVADCCTCQSIQYDWRCTSQRKTRRIICRSFRSNE